jgi:hypothetical protein
MIEEEEINKETKEIMIEEEIMITEINVPHLTTILDDQKINHLLLNKTRTNKDRHKGNNVHNNKIGHHSSPK